MSVVYKGELSARIASAQSPRIVLEAFIDRPLNRLNHSGVIPDKSSDDRTLLVYRSANYRTQWTRLVVLGSNMRFSPVLHVGVSGIRPGHASHPSPKRLHTNNDDIPLSGDLRPLN